ncbi:hypothetical protein GQ43DRAFT_212323 [Delitschia confertaspora ATCC 74209]|uniref:Uncharacterized protein n=1 Tax=Delitschia confertaspora ATCC 74209 TaxID=1513339 RepID=A0A9P4JDH4_9PLEO|nr:hypothetical protein GQ43DRAFT_212323 [Delitschia confertaspora ATCC 74209]
MYTLRLALIFFALTTWLRFPWFVVTCQDRCRQSPFLGCSRSYSNHWALQIWNLLSQMCHGFFFLKFVFYVATSGPCWYSLLFQSCLASGLHQNSGACFHAYRRACIYLADLWSSTMKWTSNDWMAILNFRFLFFLLHSLRGLG